MKNLHTFEEFVNEGILVDPSRYVRAHGKSPKGRGMWAFEINGEKIFTPSSMSYSDAVKWIKGKAKELKSGVVFTLS